MEKRKEFNLDIDVKDKRTGNTALMWAAKRGHSRVRIDHEVFSRELEYSSTVPFENILLAMKNI